MSGVEIVGLAASVIQIADLGGKLSVKLFTFTRKVKNADKSIDALSRDIAATGAVLKELGETLSKDDSLRICSQEAINTARSLVEDTKQVFVKLEKIVTGSEQADIKAFSAISLKQRLKFPFLESHIDTVQANLERLKSSLLVILNVLVFAEQLRNQEALPLLKDQRELILLLISEKQENEKRYEQIVRTIEAQSSKSDKTYSNDHILDKDSDMSTATLATTATGREDDYDAPDSTLEPQRLDKPEMVYHKRHIVLPRGLEHHRSQILDHARLVQNTISEVSSLRYCIGHGIRDKMRQGVLNQHWQQWKVHRAIHGYRCFHDLLADYQGVADFWTDAQLMQEYTDKHRLPFKVEDVKVDMNSRVIAGDTYSLKADELKGSKPEKMLEEVGPASSPASDNNVNAIGCSNKVERERERVPLEDERRMEQTPMYDDAREQLQHDTEKRQPDSEADSAIDNTRPTWIKVRTKHLSPETLDFYNLPWEYYGEEYILIRQNISHELQEELFMHTRELSSTSKSNTTSRRHVSNNETVVTLKPSHVYKHDRDKMFVVREKSSKDQLDDVDQLLRKYTTLGDPELSRATSHGHRRNWIFT